MKIEEIKHLAQLSKLTFTDEELENFSKDFESLVALADVIKNANIEGERKLNIMNLTELREDKAQDSTDVSLLLKNSPIVKKDSIVIPRIME